ncbi:hypothetical protein Cni_G04326 [Canna indica]|uniref:Sodium/calcium exchanger membrane region domain-containing protein n=1 Tax=Canna indica TaxID=4628 RepID=A0AAQ3Q4D7_9LILI|nr:hypothetical protein Cni_G04326 [Canna indica]
MNDLHLCSKSYLARPSMAKKVVHLFPNIAFLSLILFYASVLRTSTKINLRGQAIQLPDESTQPCYDLIKDKTSLLNSEAQFSAQGFINYLYIFCCICGAQPGLGYFVLILWLVVLFYLLADTSSNYFCANLEGLSMLLKLPPTIAGVTLLSLGNGAPDAFSSIVSFMGKGSGAVGLNSVLGGSFFVSCVVVGVISICVGSHKDAIDKPGFIRDLVFFLLVLLVLMVILITGKINFWGAVGFTSLYLVYIFLVVIGHYFFSNEDLPTDLEAPLLNGETASISEDASSSLCKSKTAFIDPAEARALESNATESSDRCGFGKILRCLELPLSLPRRLTIPDVSKERWSKPIAVASATLAPVLLAILLNSKRNNVGSEESWLIYISGGVIGFVLGVAAAVKTVKERPPTRFQLPWLAAGFLMSVTWTYIIAQELVSLLVSLGTVLEISTSILGLTVLAWGNSVGDLIACLTVALHDRQGGIQVAMTGCYSGPIFNILVGLGLSFVFSSWSTYPSNVVIPKDITLYQTIGFMIGGLLWAMVILPRRGMRIDRVFGSGLLSIYFCSLSLRIVQSFGLV